MYQLQNGERVDEATTGVQRQQIQTDTEISGVNNLFRLYKLYKFDPVLDITIDWLHLTFNMLKREFLEKMWADMGEDAGKPVNYRNPAVGGRLVREEFKHANWTN